MKTEIKSVRMCSAREIAQRRNRTNGVPRVPTIAAKTSFLHIPESIPSPSGHFISINPDMAGSRTKKFMQAYFTDVRSSCMYFCMVLA